MHRAARLIALTSLFGAACAEPDVTAGESAADAPRGGKRDAAAAGGAHFACESDSPICVVDGDEPVWGARGARIYLARVAREAGAAPLERASALIAGSDEWGAEERWDAETRRALTYCVDRTSLGAHADRVADAFAAASEAWEAAADVDLVHLPEHDGACREDNDAVLFRVEIAPSDATYWARAFYPSFEPSERRVRVNLRKIELDTPGGATLGFSLTAVLRHEIGHVLGFRHEHARRPTDDFACFEHPGGLIALTPYDRASVMHYPQCGGLQDYSYELSPLDRAGARFYYPVEREAAWWACPTPLAPDADPEACRAAALQIARFARDAPPDSLAEAGLEGEQARALLLARSAERLETLERLEALAGGRIAETIASYLFGGSGRCAREMGDDGRLDASCAPVVNAALALANLTPDDELASLIGAHTARRLARERPILSVRALERAAGPRAGRALYDALEW